MKNTANITRHSDVYASLTLSPNPPLIPVGPGRPGSPRAPLTPCMGTKEKKTVIIKIHKVDQMTKI